MMEDKFLRARVLLEEKSNVIPDMGLTAVSLRVELTDEILPEDAWIAEISVIGALPWYKGEERYVNLRIMSEQFREFVSSRKPRLLVRRGNEIVGYLTFDKK